jgi:hypothetical protein
MSMGNCVSFFFILQNIGSVSPRMFPNFEPPNALETQDKNNCKAVRKEANLASARRPPPPPGMRNATAAVKRMVLRARVRTVNPHCMSSAALLLVDQFGQYLESGECPTLVAVPACLCDFLLQATQSPQRACYRCSEIA